MILFLQSLKTSKQENILLKDTYTYELRKKKKERTNFKRVVSWMESEGGGAVLWSVNGSSNALLLSIHGVREFPVLGLDSITYMLDAFIYSIRFSY